MFSRRIPKKVFYHLLSWTLFISYEVLVTIGMGAHFRFFRYAAFYSLDILLFYVNAHVVFKYAFQRRYKALYVIPLVLAELYLFKQATIAANIFVDSAEAGRFIVDIDGKDYIRAIWRGVYCLGFSTAYFFILRNISNTKKANMLQIQKLEAERREAELEVAHRRSQINPHLLFNSLNFIYNAVESVSEKASKAVLQLADIMRYALTETQPDGKVELCREVEQIENYISLNQLRFTNRLSIISSIEDSCMESSLRIPPLILLTFVENMFKHGNLSDHRNAAFISIRCEGHTLHFYAHNSKARNRMEQKSEGIGINNVRMRLQNYYPEQFNLDIANNDTTFIVRLTIRL